MSDGLKTTFEALIRTLESPVDSVNNDVSRYFFRMSRLTLKSFLGPL